MDTLDDWFAYPKYRPHQREMLERAAVCARDGGIAMIDAPTGSGKSSVVSALLAESRGRKVIVAVRTISQLTTFLRELQLIREKRGGLKFAYLIGKSSMCPLGGEGDVYRRCEGVKGFSSALMRERAQRGSLVPATDRVIRQQIRRMDREHPLICPFYVASRSFSRPEEGGLRMIPSTALRVRAERVSAELIPPERLVKFCRDICPYETMLHAAREADVVLVNFHHLFDDTIRGQLYQSLGIDGEDALLLIDEAHNCGEAVQSIESVALQERDLQQAGMELAHQRKSSREAEAISRLIPEIMRFMEMLKESTEIEDWFDPAIFLRMIVRGSLYRDIEEIIEDLQSISERIREKNLQAGEFRKSALEGLCEFFYRIYRSSTDPAFLTVYHRDDEGAITLEVRNIDPGARLQEIASSHACCIMISGTLSPVESYRRFYFSDLMVATISLPNSFPRENRLVLCADDITTAYSMRRNSDNIARTEEYIETFATLPGNLAVYFPSYELLNAFAERCSSRIRGKAVFIEPKIAADANAALQDFLALPGQGRSGILFAVSGGKWSEGLDYRGEMLAGALVIGLPLAPYNRVRRMVIDYFRMRFGDEGEFISYTLPAINRALQALGRVIRTPEDRGVLVLGEKRFLEARVRDGLPPWLQEEIVRCDIGTFQKEVRAWRS
ncbi:MAG: ATP-dependent DNA helicase [Methanomicrobiaceae archaeon]|uniref:Ding family atp-dependent helicase n=1 Tax=hydrocarbon metagenome TaxID=938273 RepID=A0A0W8FFI1_9ZZZZ|nr:ATP-dependent DNA helicase [Methanomicrobiaceae archaeon]MDD5419310.1 ATP-dependent DNA helicase [Methanomicrobiaceae archaeon]